MQLLMAALLRAATSNGSPEEARKEIGQLALESEGIGEEEFLGLFAVLAGHEWPERFACTAIEASSGEFVVWRAGSAADLQHGVASSCSVPCVYAPVTIDGRRYIDGGMRNGLNIDVAAGNEQVLAISCMALSLPEGLSDPVFDALVGRISAEVEALTEAGSAVEVVGPSQEFLDLSGWGTALMDPGKAKAAYECGVRHAATEAARVAALWNR
jgi:NTE family protein